MISTLELATHRHPPRRCSNPSHKCSRCEPWTSGRTYPVGRYCVTGFLIIFNSLAPFPFALMLNSFRSCTCTSHAHELCTTISNVSLEEEKEEGQWSSTSCIHNEVGITAMGVATTSRKTTKIARGCGDLESTQERRQTYHKTRKTVVDARNSGCWVDFNQHVLRCVNVYLSTQATHARKRSEVRIRDTVPKLPSKDSDMQGNIELGTAEQDDTQMQRRR